MIEFLIKKTKLYKDREAMHERQFNKALEEIEKLKKEKEVLLSAGPMSVEEGNSSILFEIDDDLSVVTKSRINKDIVNTLIDNKYLEPSQSEDEAAIQLVFVLLANEVTEQIIENINTDEN